MRDYQNYINALRICAKDHEKDRTYTGHIIVSDLCRDTANLLEALEQDIKELPSVTPQPRKGHWIRVTDKARHLVWECDKCGWQQRFNTNYCPDCGSDMREV